MIIHNFEQDSPEWHEMRAGKITGTRLGEIFKSNNLSLMDELIAEFQTGECEYVPPNFAMRRGKELEPEAREAYEEVTGIKLIQVGFIQNSEYPFLGISPDGLSEDHTHGVEFKCPSTKKHVQYIRQKQVPGEYKYQVLAFFINNEKLITHDFVSYDPRFTAKPIFIHRTTREEIQKELTESLAEVVKFWDKTQSYYKEIIW